MKTGGFCHDKYSSDFVETEVLAPAGSIEGLKAALYAGADAVYTGGRMFGARAYANNLSDEELSECIDYCQLHNKKLYLIEGSGSPCESRGFLF